MPSMTQSIMKLQKKLDKDPNSLIFFQLAEEHRKEGNLEEAMRILKAGLSRHPNYWSARAALGRIYHQLGNPEPAKEELEKVVQAVPDNLLANRLLGDIYLRMHLPAEALKRYRIVQMLTPADQDVIDRVKRLEGEVAQTPAPAKTPEPVVVSEPLPPFLQNDQNEEGLSAPTIQLQVPEHLEKTEVSLASDEVTFKTTQSGAETLILKTPIAESWVPPAPEVVSENISGPVEEMFAATSSSDEMNQENVENDQSIPVLEEPEILEEDLETSRDAEELSSLANLLMSAERNPVEEFDELEHEMNVEPEIEEEEFLRDPHTDRTQPIDNEEENQEADELTSETLAELYLNQGFIDKAIKVYQRLLLDDPENKRISLKLQELGFIPAAPVEAEPLYEKEEVLVPEPVPEERVESFGASDLSRRAEGRKRKINTLENWLTTIRRERD